MNNFERIYLSSTESERKMGFYWYSDAHAYLKAMALEFDKPFPVVVAITATLSPRNSWAANLNQAYMLIKYKGKVPAKVKFSTFGQNVRKAKKILKTGQTWHCSGPKVEQFYQNLINPFDANAVTIDSFMLAAWYNLSLENNGRAINKYFNVRYIEPLKNEIKALANKYEMLPCQMQAIIWIAYHREIRSMVSYSGQIMMKLF